MAYYGTNLIKIKSLATKSLIVFVALITAVSGQFLIMQQASADTYDDKMQQLQKQIDSFNSKARQYAQQARTLQAELDRLSSEKAAIEAQIKLTKTKYNKLKSEIKQNEIKLQNTKDALGQIIADMYVDNTISPIEMLASSKNIGDYVDQQEYRSSIRDSLGGTIEEVKVIKIKLEQDKVQVEKILEQQSYQQQALAKKEAEQAELVEKTRGQEAAFQRLALDSRNKLNSVAAQQQAYYEELRRRNNGRDVSSQTVGNFSYRNFSGLRGCAGGYPYCAPQDSQVDPWALYNRECVSYAAWAIYNRFGKQVNPFNGQGNAYEWVYSAPAYSGAWRVYDPKPGDAVVLPVTPAMGAYLGHLMVVEANYGNGWVKVSQYNFHGTGQYSTMDIAVSGVVFLRFPNR